MVDEVLEVLAPEVVVAYLASLGEGVVVVFEAVDGAVVGYSDEEGASIAGVGEAGDGLDGGGLDELGLLLLGFVASSTQSRRRSTVNGRITRPYSDCLYTPRNRSATDQINAPWLLIVSSLIQNPCSRPPNLADG